MVRYLSVLGHPLDIPPDKADFEGVPAAAIRLAACPTYCLEDPRDLLKSRGPGSASDHSARIDRLLGEINSRLNGQSVGGRCD
jgi:hypothetical protein